MAFVKKWSMLKNVTAQASLALITIENTDFSTILIILYNRI